MKKINFKKLIYLKLFFIFNFVYSFENTYLGEVSDGEFLNLKINKIINNNLEKNKVSYELLIEDLILFNEIQDFLIFDKENVPVDIDYRSIFLLSLEKLINLYKRVIELENENQRNRYIIENFINIILKLEKVKKFKSIFKKIEEEVSEIIETF